MKSDLVVVVADGGMEQAMRGILARHQSLGIRRLSGVEYPKLHRLDQGVYASGHEIARLYCNSHEHALVMLDFAWEGRPTDDPVEMRDQIEGNLRRDWGKNGRCVLIVPELEVWLWSDSPHVAQELGWDTMQELRQWLEARQLWQPGAIKPGDPKLAYEEAIREKRIQKSNATFQSVASKVSLKRCTDSSFRDLVSILREWFSVGAVSEVVP